MESLSLSHGRPHLVRRDEVFNDVICMYQEELSQLLQEYPFRCQFKGEEGFDVGGVSRDMYSAFYEESYKRLYDGSTLLSPIVHPEMDVSILTTMGTIISHAYMVTGILPIRIAFPCLARCLLGMGTPFSPSVLIETFIDSLSPYEGNIIKAACEEVTNGCPEFSSDVMPGLLSLLSRFNCRKLPVPQQFYQIIGQVANYEFLSKPSAALVMVNSGIPAQHKPYWDSISASDLFSVYQAQSVSACTVLKMLEDAVGDDASQERILGYLRQFVGSMGSDALRNFLRFVTGSSACSSLKISVSFNSLSGAARRPIAHTCGPSLELSWMYSTYPEFVDEFMACIANPYSWVMNAV